MCKAFFLIISFIIFNFPCTADALDEWRSSFPPVGMEIDQVIVDAFATKFNAVVKGEKVPFSRRLLQLKNGEIDLLAGLLKDESREQYAYFFKTPYKLKTNKIFIMRKGESDQLQTYEDLYKFQVGVQIGSRYFSRFDEDPKIKRVQATGDKSRFNMLLKNRFDVLIHTGFYGTYLVNRLGLQDKVEIAPFKYTKSNPVYIAISKKSELYKQKDSLEKVFTQMKESGEFDRVIHSYFESISMPVPEYK